MKTPIVTLLILALLCATEAAARLGETEAQLKARFGEPKMKGANSIISQGKIRELGVVHYYRQEDWSIACTMVGGRCMKVFYGKPGDWTEDQIRTVLSSNTQSAAWKEVTKPNSGSFRRTWARSDGSRATWTKGMGFELVWSAYDVAEAKLKEQARVEAARQPKI